MLGRKKKPETVQTEPKSHESKTHDPLRRLGVLDDEDVQLMLQGSKMMKVRSQRWRKDRSLKLLEDCVTVWCESSKASRKGKSQQTFCVTEVECVREGCQSECLRRMAGLVPETHCFTVVFRGGRKSLDLCCSTQDEAERWVRGLRTLKDRVSNMTRKNLFMTQNGFTMHMLSKENDVFNPDHAHVYQDMSRPLAHYYISSSHNTYLTKDQVTSASSTEPYIRALHQGCRCVELDCWDGDKGEPMIYHGHTLTSKVLFKEVIETIAQYAFKTSPYPLILSVENHCSVEQQAVMAQHLRSILGKKLLRKPLNDLPLKDLPSPEELMGRILLKGKKLGGLLGKTESWTSFSCSSDEESTAGGGGNKKESKKDPGRAVSTKLSPELSDLVVYCQSVPFSGFETASQRPPSMMSSFSENEALKLIKDSGKLYVRHNSRQLSRVYPSGQRLQSSNYDPQDMWNGGCQMVALNFQTPGEQMDLNQGRFLPNSRCGYVLKPDFLCHPKSNFGPENTGGGPGHIPTQLTIRVISAQQLPKINTDNPNSIVDPQVWVEIHGVSIDKARAKTQRIDNNGFNPRWDCTVSFQLQVPELALVRFMVEDHDYKSKNDFIGQFTLPFTSLRTGYRHVHLLKADGSSLSPATLFIHVKVVRRGVPIKTVSERIGKA
uniref:Phosphoinositide phospholipase C n=1 Tax=Sinocyclocheilus rhinocerous TaxID=307959 RepID=A0A673ILT3_9TELE